MRRPCWSAPAPSRPSALCSTWTRQRCTPPPLRSMPRRAPCRERGLCMACRWPSRTTSTLPACQPRPAARGWPGTGRACTPACRGGCWTPARWCLARRICTSGRRASPATTMASGRRAIRSTARASRAAPVAATRGCSGCAPRRWPSAPTRAGRGAGRGRGGLLGLRATRVAIGTDRGGSVRVPAALCGLVGFRPTVRRWPDEGLVPIAPTFDTAGVMARCVDDCVLLDHAVAAGPVRLAATPLAGGRLGVPDACFWEAVDPPAAELARERLELLRAAGAVLVPCDLADAGALFRQGSMTISLYEILPALAGYFARHGRPFDPRALTDAVVSPDVRPLFERLFGATAITPEAYAHAPHPLRARMQAAYRECFAPHDVAALVFPTSPLTAARIGQDMEVTLCGRPIPAFSAYIRNPGPAGMAGLPALSLPMGLAANGLPAGLELTGAQGTDTKLLALALGIEAALPKAPIAAAVQELANR